MISAVRSESLVVRLDLLHSFLGPARMDMSLNDSMEIEGHEVAASPRPKLVVKVKKFHAVATWKWQTREDTCGICHSSFDGTCGKCHIPGEDCPPCTPSLCFSNFMLLVRLKSKKAHTNPVVQNPLQYGESALMSSICTAS